MDRFTRNTPYMQGATSSFKFLSLDSAWIGCYRATSFVNEVEDEKERRSSQQENQLVTRESDLDTVGTCSLSTCED